MEMFLRATNTVLLVLILGVLIFSAMRKPAAVALVEPVKIAGVVDVKGKVEVLDISSLGQPIRVKVEQPIRVMPDDVEGMPMRMKK